MEYIYTVSTEFDGKKLSVFLRFGCGVSASLIRSVKYTPGMLQVNGQDAHTNRVLRAGDRVRLETFPEQSALTPCDIEVPIVYESADIIVFDKPAGLATHPTRNYPDGTLANVFARLMQERGEAGNFHPTNRLDKNTSGLVLAAKNRLSTPLAANSAKKSYIAIAQGTFDAKQGVIDAPIGLSQGSIMARCVRADGAPSVTEYRVLQQMADHALLHIETHTGRTHQIRVHMAHIGHPLAGDDMYGGSTDRISRHALHCARLSFTEPATGQTVCLESPLPDDMRALVSGISTL